MKSKYSTCIKEYLHCVKKLFSRIHYDSALNGLLYSYWKPLGKDIATAPLSRKIERKAWMVLGWFNEKKPLNKEMRKAKKSAIIYKGGDK